MFGVQFCAKDEPVDVQIYEFEGFPVYLRRKSIKTMRLAIHPPDGRVTLSIPKSISMTHAMAFLSSKREWIFAKRHMMQTRMTQHASVKEQWIDGERHWVWGKQFDLQVQFENSPRVHWDGHSLILVVHPNATEDQRGAVMMAWHKQLLHEAIPPLIAKWEAILKVQVTQYHLQRMKTRWGTCNTRNAHIRINTELVKKPPHLLEYVIVHELAHLIEPSHNHRFKAVMNQHYPTWRQAQQELNPRNV